MSRFNEKKEGTKTTNVAGGIAYSHSDEMALIVASVTTFLEDKFYESKSKRLKRIQELCHKVDHEFLGKLAVMARRDCHMRSVSHVLIGELARLHRGDDLVKRVMLAAVERPDDLTEIVSYLGKPLPKQVKRGIRHALLKFSPYQLAKYRMEDKKVKLVDLFNLAHPNAAHATEEQEQAWKDLIQGKLKSTDTWESRLSSGEDKATVWKDLIEKKKLGYMALLRNLRNIDQQADEVTKRKACEMISNREEVKKSKQLPFRFFNAFEHVTNQRMLEAIAQALEYSLDNVPHFEGTTLIAVDGSGSMGGEPIKKASIFAAALMKANDADLILYDTQVKESKTLRMNPVLTIAREIQAQANGGGTNTSLVFQYAYQTKKKYDRIIILSDNESWADYGGGTNATYNMYRRETGNDPFVYAIDLAGHGTKDVAGGRVFHLAGWSEKMFDFMKWIEKENEMVTMVKAVTL